MEFKVGTIAWRDLTVPNAGEVKDFYCDVIGWTAMPESMGDYEDYHMMLGDESQAGVCHARGSNAKVPPQWLIYIIVESVATSVEKAVARGGELIDGPRKMGGMNFACLRDPAGAVFAIMDQQE